MTAPAPPAPATLLCPACGATAVPGDRFCEACGADLPLTEGAEAEAEAEAAAAATAQPEIEYAADVAPPTPPGPPCVSCGADAAQIQDRYCGVCGMKQPAPRDHIEVSYDGVAAVTDRGRKHYRNEDAFALRVVAGQPLIAIVCDGVSTTVDPDLASQAAADTALAVLAGGGDPVAAHVAAQAAVVAVTDQPPPPDLGWPSCTFLTGVVTGDVVDLATLGDCRTFWLPTGDEPPATLTEDDSWAADQIAAGAMTAEEAYAHPMAHTITRWLGRDADPSWTPRRAQFHAPGPGRLILCSDGLWNYAETAAEVAAAAAPPDAGGANDPLSVARRLVDFANEHGGHDNITVVVIDTNGPDMKGTPS